MTLEDISAIITPTALLLLCLILVLKLRRDVNPIVLSMVKGLSIQAQSNSLYFAMLTLVAGQIAFGVMTDESRMLGFAKIAACSKVIALTCGGVLAYMIKAPANSFSDDSKKTVITDKTP